MPLPGGPASKFGPRYEKWWTVSQLIRIIEGKADSLRIEHPAYPKAEFVLSVGNCREFHQTKRSNLNGKWSLSGLQSDNLLQAIFEYLFNDQNTRFVFVSGSDAPVLKELTERANQANSQEEFESKFLNFANHKQNVSTLKEVWDNPDDAAVYNVLQRIEFRTIDEKGIEEQVRQSLSLLFLNNANEICDAMRALVEDSIHKVIDRNLLDSTLKERGFISRRLPNPKNAPMLVDEVTNDYLNRIERQLINRTLIPRSNFQPLLTALMENETNTDCVVTGNAGGGKSASILELVNNLRQADTTPAVLAFRLDGMEPVPSTKALGERLGLEESPALVLKAAAEVQSGEAVLIIDQLDAVSSISGRRPDFIDVIEALLEEVNACRNAVKIHIVLVCRKFDWENDHRLRRSLAKEPIAITVSDFSQEEVRTILLDHGFNPDSIRKQNLKLLGLPQNLAMFLEISKDADIQSTFTSVKDLYDEYWNVKRQSVKRRADSGDHWIDVIQQLCDEMSSSQQLSIPKEILDRFPAEYVNSMTSEGVLSYHGRRYRFSHESFFDYCFARDYFLKSISLTDFLKASEQHLFRRAQVRQILEYLHDADLERYCSELNKLLRDDKIRYHLKDLAIALAVRFSDPSENEWNVFAPWINAEIEAIECGQKNEEGIASTVWNFFFYSESWFQLADRKGLIASWLESENDRLIDKGVEYVEFHRRHSGDRVAELLEPFIDKGDEWHQRLYRIMLWPEQGNSRRFFDLFLKSIDNGILDSADKRVLGSMGFGAKEQPSWIAEITAHWLNRRLNLVSEGSDGSDWHNWLDLIGLDGSGSDDIKSSASIAPEAYARHVLPVVLKISDAAVLSHQVKPPIQDAVWSLLTNSEYARLDEAIREAVATAIEKVAETNSIGLDEVLNALRSRNTLIANYFLLRAYTAGAEHLTDDAVAELCKNTWRFDCEYSGKQYWLANQLIGAIFPHCSDKNRIKLEQTTLNYVPDYERSPEGYKSRGYASYSLISGIPVSMRSEVIRGRYRELKRKFGTLSMSPPMSIGSGFFESPIEEEAMEKMTDEQWLSAIDKYESGSIPFDRTKPFRGGAVQLAQRMESCVKEEPERFARLSLRLSAETNPVYLDHVLRGLRETDVSAELKLEVCRKAYIESRDHCDRSIADILGSLEERLPDDAIKMLDWLATEGTAVPTVWTEDRLNAPHGIDLYTVGLNTVRGHAAIVISSLMQRDASYISRFKNTVIQLAGHASEAIRACVARTLWAIAIHDWKFALDLFCNLLEPRGNQVKEDRLLATEFVERFVHMGLSNHFDRLECVVARMLRSCNPETRTVGARLASLAVLYENKRAVTLVNEALNGDYSQRIGVAQVAARKVGRNECKEWAEQRLTRFFNDPEKKVRKEASSCFSSIENEPLEQYEDLINRFCESIAFQETPWDIISALEKNTHRLPGITYFVCAKLLQLTSDKQDIHTTPRAVEIYTVTDLVLRMYHQHQGDKWGPKCLDLIDLMCRHEIRDNIRRGMGEFER